MPFYDATNYDLDRSLGFLLGTLFALITEDLDRILTRELGIAMPQWRVLTVLQFGALSTAAELCAELRHDSGAMTRMLDKLAALDLVVREHDETDRRAHRLRLTKKGTLLANRGFELARENLNDALSDMSDTQSEQLIALLRKLKGSMLARRAARRSPASRTTRRRP